MAKNMLLNNVEIDTQTSYFVNGDIHVFACPWVEEPVLIEKEKTSYRGRMTVMSNGDTKFKAYQDGTKGRMYEVLFETEHCRILKYNSGRIVEQWNFDKKLSIHQIWCIRKREMPTLPVFHRAECTKTSVSVAM